MNEEKQRKSAFYDAALCIALYLLCVSIPAPAFLEQASFTGALRFLFLPLIALILFPEGISFPIDWKRVFLCAPVLLATLGNIASLPFQSSVHAPNADSLLRLSLFTVATAVGEEWVFRYGVFRYLGKSKWKRFDILISAAVFSVCHLFALLSGAAILPTFAQAGYTFALGILLGFVYKFAGLLPVILIHFFFNLFQNDLFTLCCDPQWNAPFFLFNIVCFGMALGYALLLWLKAKKKQNLLIL